MKEKMNKYDMLTIILICINAIVGVMAFFLLKGDIPILWNGSEASKMVEKRYILLFPVISIILASTGKIFINNICYKWFCNANEKTVAFINMFLQIVLLTIQIYIVLYTLGLRISIGIILIIEVIIGVVCGEIINIGNR